MEEVERRLIQAVRNADDKFTQLGGDTTMQWIPIFMQELARVGLEICLTQRTPDGDAMREKNVVIQNIGGGTFIEVPAKKPRRRR